MWNLRRNDTTDLTEWRLTDLENELVAAGGGEKGRGEGIVREFGINMYTLLYLEWITNKGLLYSAGNSAQCCEATWMRGKFGGEWIHVYVWLCPSAIRLKLSQHC